MMVVGPTGAGKSVLLALIAMQYRRYPGARIVIFDMGFSARAAVLAMGGSHHGLGPQPEHGDGGGLAFQPLRDIDDETERSWAADWIGALLRSEEHTSELQSLMRLSYAVFCLKKKTHIINKHIKHHIKCIYPPAN